MTFDEANSLALNAFNLGIYAKNLEYNTFAEMPFETVKILAGSAGQTCWLLQNAYKKFGVQIQVQKEVSDDLLISDFTSGSFADVPWPGKICEVYSEDPKIPTILVLKCSPKDIESWFPNLTVGLKSEEYVSAVIQEGSGLTSKMLSLNLKPEMYNNFLTNSETDSMSDLGLVNSALSPQDNATLAVLMRLVLKVFAFISIPTFKPVSINRKEMKWGGKPGVKNRPNRPAMRCIYAPTVRYEKGETEKASGKHIHFKGRRGHFRYFRSEVFTKKRGQWTYIQPVSVEKVVIKVRKPK